jgi:hypothetical protein
MKARYRHAIEWIALNDGVDTGLELKLGTSWIVVKSKLLDWHVVSNQQTVVLIADLFGTTPERVAKAVVRFRQYRLQTYLDNSPNQATSKEL